MSALTVAEFRANFPEFADPTKYTDAQANFWLVLSTHFLNECVWTDVEVYKLGQQLFIAHSLVLSARDESAESHGGTAGEVKGPVSSKSVDKVSVAYASHMVALENGADWNLTSYGIRFLRLARMMGMGGVQIMPAAPFPNLNNPYIPYNGN